MAPQHLFKTPALLELQGASRDAAGRYGVVEGGSLLPEIVAGLERCVSESALRCRSEVGRGWSVADRAKQLAGT